MTSPLAPTDEGAVAERLRERILVNFALYDKLTHNLKLCLSFRGAERRGNPFSSGIMCIPLAVHMGCGLRDRCAHRSRNDKLVWIKRIDFSCVENSRQRDGHYAVPLS